jgi:TonB family protein
MRILTFALSLSLSLIINSAFYRVFETKGINWASESNNVAEEPMSEFTEKSGENSHCDERFKLFPSLRAGKVVGIIPFQSNERNSPIAEFTVDNKVFKTKYVINLEEVDILTGLTTGGKAEYFEVETLNMPDCNFAVGEIYIFEIGKLGVNPQGKGEFEYALNYIKPNGYFKNYRQANADITFFRETKVKDFEPFREILGVKEGEAIAGGIVSGKAKNLVRPTYPVKAKKQKLSGAVQVLILVNEEGKVIKAKALCPNYQILGESAEKAALASSFSPTMLSGKPVKVKGTIIYNFVK